MTEPTRWKVHAAVLISVEFTDDTDPVAWTLGQIEGVALTSGFKVEIVGTASARRVYQVGDHVEWSRSMPDGTSHAEYGLLVDNAGAVMLTFADGTAIPLPPRLVS